MRAVAQQLVAAERLRYIDRSGHRRNRAAEFQGVACGDQCAALSAGFHDDGHGTQRRDDAIPQRKGATMRSVFRLELRE